MLVTVAIIVAARLLALKQNFRIKEASQNAPVSDCALTQRRHEKL